MFLRNSILLQFMNKEYNRNYSITTNFDIVISYSLKILLCKNHHNNGLFTKFFLVPGWYLVYSNGLYSSQFFLMDGVGNYLTRKITLLFHYLFKVSTLNHQKTKAGILCNKKLQLKNRRFFIGVKMDLYLKI